MFTADTRPATDLDRLAIMLFQDEFHYLLTVKGQSLLEGKRMRLEPTKLDSLVRIWQDIFPDNTVMREQGTLRFSTPGGSDLISTSKLFHAAETASSLWIIPVCSCIPPCYMWSGTP